MHADNPFAFAPGIDGALAHIDRALSRTYLSILYIAFDDIPGYRDRAEQARGRRPLAQAQVDDARSIELIVAAVKKQYWLMQQWTLQIGDGGLVFKRK